LADFQSLWKEFEAQHVKVVAGSVDPRNKTQEYAEKLGLSYPVAYGMVAGDISRLTGAFYEKEKEFLHATGFLVHPDRTIEVAVYSTGPVGRFVAQDILNLVKYYKGRKSSPAYRRA
jgi:alkyl hydroperoxide reductase subunit AhpC